MHLASKIYDVPDIWAAQELYHANGWTDGLPIGSAAVSEASAPARFLGVDVLTRPAHREVTPAASDQHWPSPTSTLPLASVGLSMEPIGGLILCY